MSIRIRETLQEMQQEVKIDKEIDAIVNRWLKKNRTFFRTDKKENASAFFIFIRSNLSRYSIAFAEKDNPLLDNYNADERTTVVFLKNKNSHDKNKTTIGHINRNMSSAKKFYS